MDPSPPSSDPKTRVGGILDQTATVADFLLSNPPLDCCALTKESFNYLSPQPCRSGIRENSKSNPRHRGFATLVLTRPTAPWIYYSCALTRPTAPWICYLRTTHGIVELLLLCSHSTHGTVDLLFLCSHSTHGTVDLLSPHDPRHRGPGTLARLTAPWDCYFRTTHGTVDLVLSLDPRHRGIATFARSTAPWTQCSSLPHQNFPFLIAAPKPASPRYYRPTS